MSYTPPKIWAHGDQVDAADLQTYSDNQAIIYDVLGDYSVNAGFALSQESGPYAVEREGSYYIMLHVGRWLYFQSSGEISDWAGVEDPVSLTEDETGGITQFDLEDIDWLSYGQRYIVTGCTFAGEVFEP